MRWLVLAIDLNGSLCFSPEQLLPDPRNIFHSLLYIGKH